MTIQKPKQSVLITGCSEGGIGYALAKEFQSHGLHVFATARNQSKMASLETLPNVTLLTLDVTSASSISEAVKAVTTQTGGRLTFLVNNSGSQYVSPILDLDISMAKEMYEVNVWGVIAVTKAFAQLIIEEQGSIINLASIAGYLYPPWMGLYSASKSCLDTISETLRLEMKPFGVKVVTVITGAIETNIFVNAPEHRLPADSIYKAAANEVAARATGTDVSQHSKREDFARDLVRDILGGASGKVYRGAMASTIRFVGTYLPTTILDKIIEKGTGLDKIASIA